MDSFEINKILGAFLGVIAFVVALGIFSEALFDQEEPKKPGFSVAAASPNAGGGEGSSQQAVAEEDPPVEKVLASADAVKGENVFKACAACHNIDKDGPNRVGPNLYGIVGGPKVHKSDFNYSKGMQDAAAKGPWDYKALYEFLKNPKGYVPGTAMAFPGLRKAKDRADVIAYLRSKSDNPPPLPK
jgi:cytochrome c2